MQLHVGAPAALEGKRRQLFSNSQPAWRFALVKASSAAKGSTPKDQMERYSRWWQESYLSSTGRCFDIGLTVSADDELQLATCISSMRGGISPLCHPCFFGVRISYR